MIRTKCPLLAAVTVMFLSSYGISEAAHFSLSGTSNIHASNAETLTRKSPCDWVADKGVRNTAIVADAGETLGDPVIVNYCYALKANSSIGALGDMVIGGVGGALLTAGCDPGPFYNNLRPVTLILNRGVTGEKTVMSYGPLEIYGNTKFSLTNQCGWFQAFVGDTIEFNGGVFAVLSGPTFPQPNTSISISFTIDISVISARCCPE